MQRYLSSLIQSFIVTNCLMVSEITSEITVHYNCSKCPSVYQYLSIFWGLMQSYSQCNIQLYLGLGLLHFLSSCLIMRVRVQNKFLWITFNRQYICNAEAILLRFFVQSICIMTWCQSDTIRYICAMMLSVNLPSKATLSSCILRCCNCVILGDRTQI